MVMGNAAIPPMATTTGLTATHLMMAGWTGTRTWGTRTQQRPTSLVERRTAEDENSVSKNISNVNYIAYNIVTLFIKDKNREMPIWEQLG